LVNALVTYDKVYIVFAPALTVIVTEYQVLSLFVLWDHRQLMPMLQPSQPMHQSPMAKCLSSWYWQQLPSVTGYHTLTLFVLREQLM
jgi:hypothetical protein